MPNLGISSSTKVLTLFEYEWTDALSDREISLSKPNITSAIHTRPHMHSRDNTPLVSPGESIGNSVVIYVMNVL